MAKRPREVNPIDVVEAAYDLDGDDAAWLRQLVTIVRPLVDGGRGIMAYFYDHSAPLVDLHKTAQIFDLDPKSIPDGDKWVRSKPEFTRFVHTHNDGLLGMSELCKRAGIDVNDWPEMKRFYKHAGLKDYAALQTVEPGGKGVVISAGQLEQRSFGPRTRRLWNRVTAHIASGRRLRAAIAESGASEEAILKPNGTLEHAEGDGTSKTSREALRDAVQRTEKARGKLRKQDPEGATEVWTALVSGRWSLVDRYETGGRRYIVARRNEHTLRDPRALTQRERAISHLAALGKSNKLIGYELGLSESTVGSHLHQVMRKLGVKTRVELMQLIAQLGSSR